MKYKILEVKKRNWLMQYASIDRWKVTVKLEDGTIKKLNCWAGCPNFGTSIGKTRLIYSIDKELRMLNPSKPENLKELEGTEQEF